MAITTRVVEGGRTSITQPYHINGSKGYNYDHWGIDLTGYNGSYNVLAWVLAHSAGTVVELRNNCRGYEENSYGNYVLLRHDNGMYTMYAHGSYNTVQVRVGQRVAKGQRLFYMGNTGHSFGGHLHFEIRQSNGYKIDPEPYLNSELPNGGNSYWLPPVTGYNVNDFNNGFAGTKQHPCDRLAIKGKNIKYRVKLKDTQTWLPFVYGKDYNLNDSENGYAGISGRAFDQVEICTLDGGRLYNIAFDMAQGRWLPEVVNTNVINDNIGYPNHSCGGVAVRESSIEYYCVSEVR